MEHRRHKHKLKIEIATREANKLEVLNSKSIKCGMNRNSNMICLTEKLNNLESMLFSCSQKRQTFTNSNLQNNITTK